ncbi:hypothetical protein MASR2M39_31380 [Ignavibacteriales bacterium]
MSNPEPSTNSHKAENISDTRKYKYKFRGDSPIEQKLNSFREKIFPNILQMLFAVGWEKKVWL